MHNGVDIRITFQNLAMDVAFCVAADCAVDGCAIRNEVFGYVGGAGHCCWTDLQRDEERCIGVWITNADMAKGIEDVVVGEDVVRCYERGE